MIKKNIKRIVIITLGVLFTLLGLVGLVLPVLQGWLFLIIGALLLSIYSPSLRKFIDTHTAKYPKLHKVVIKAQGWIERVFGAPEV